MYVIRATAVAALVRVRVGVARGEFSAGAATEDADAGETGEGGAAGEGAEAEPAGRVAVTAPLEDAVAWSGCVLVSVRSSRVMACPFETAERRNVRTVAR
ncbi:hypothetical protein [Streptomyces sp. NPDC006446]|uniref:hypothetical protein n=1 Tax=Streptomyces sp. NPDC006446 TaxID=3154301 RepID=UPI0033B5A145